MNSKPDTILLINGLWMTALSWEHWVKYYTPTNLTTSLPLWLLRRSSAVWQVDGAHRVHGIPRSLHYMLGQDGWQEVADWALDWAAKHASRVAVSA